MQKKLKLFFVLQLTLLMLFTWGCGKQTAEVKQAAQPAKAAAETKSENVFKGPVVGKSNKAKTISITVGKGDTAKTMMVRFDENTKGVEYAAKGEAAIIQWEQRGEDKFATVIKPKLAKLPEGVTEIQTEELYELMANGADLFLVDARPKSRYDQAHLPGAVSIPVPKLKEKKASVLPDDKDKLLVFYCGGYT
ncbi:MAG: rhodanese-like domain-containing protein [Desulfobulbaceae bacterium]|nr:MAG: rhodanese-like domain-containing protein [Desulfobulbaceae bacterium]